MNRGKALDPKEFAERPVGKTREQLLTLTRLGWCFLPADSQLGLPEMIVDLRRLHSIQIDLLRPLIQVGERRARLQPLYREHLAKHFADRFSRIGLPRPYETM